MAFITTAYHKLYMQLVEESCISMVDTFEPFTETDIIHLLKWSSNVFYVVDPMPRWLAKICLDVLISTITKIVKKHIWVFSQDP